MSICARLSYGGPPPFFIFSVRDIRKTLLPHVTSYPALIFSFLDFRNAFRVSVPYKDDGNLQSSVNVKTYRLGCRAIPRFIESLYL